MQRLYYKDTIAALGIMELMVSILNVCMVLVASKESFTRAVTATPNKRYTVYKDDVDYEEARTLCGKNGGALAEFHGDQDINLKLLISRADDIPSYGQFWIKENVSYVMTSTCACLSMPHNLSNIDITMTNCSRKMGYICQVFHSSSMENSSNSLPTTQQPSRASFSSIPEQITDQKLLKESTHALYHNSEQMSTQNSVTGQDKHVDTQTAVASLEPSVTQPFSNSEYTQALTCAQICCSNINLFCNTSLLKSEENYSIIIHKLKVDAKTTSKQLRRLSSANDVRISSKAMGIGAVLIICTVVACIVAMDVPNLVNFVKYLKQS